MAARVIVGGGLVGSLLAVVLARRGHNVTVYERRPDPRAAGAIGGRSINLVLTRRGIRALERVGLAEGALNLTVPVTGRMMHDVDGNLAHQPYGRDDTECNYSVPRAGLNAYLMDAAEEAGVTFCFDSPLKDADIQAGTLTFQQPNADKPLTIETEVIYGCDGAASAVRKAFEKLDNFQVSIEMLSHGYKELSIPPMANGEYALDPHSLHIWPRDAFMLMALANQGGSFTVTLFAPNEGTNGFSTLGSSAEVEDYFKQYFPDALPLMPSLTDEFSNNPVGELGTVRCEPWHYQDKALLLGDASHAIVPFFGQGMNSGFEDCRVLDDLLETHGDDRKTVFPEFTARRKPNADAIADLALENFVEMRDKVADQEFLFRKRVEQRLEQAIPYQYRSRYSMVMYSHIPFRLCQAAGEIQKKLLDKWCHPGLGSPADLDLEKAKRDIQKKLTPFLEEHGVKLDY